MAQLIDGNKIAEEIFAKLRQQVQLVKARGGKLQLVVVMVGENRASLSYINQKLIKGRELGIDVQIREFSEEIAQEELVKEIKQIATQNISGILVQLPLPKKFREQEVLDAVPRELDVDGLTTENKESLDSGAKVLFIPPAAAAIEKIFEEQRVDLENKQIVLVGAGQLIGQPLAALFKKRALDFEVADRHTKNLKELTLDADVIITGVGKEKLLTGDMIKEGAIVIDGGTTGSAEGSIVGDVDFESVEPKASILAPVPGGVGPVTIAMLFTNVLRAASSKLNLE